MVMKWQINVPENFHFADVHGNAFVVEKTAAIQAVRRPGDFGEKDFLFSTNNYLAEPMKATKEGGFVGAHGGYGAYSAPRNKMIWDLCTITAAASTSSSRRWCSAFPGRAASPARRVGGDLLPADQSLDGRRHSRTTGTRAWRISARVRPDGCSSRRSRPTAR